MAAENHPVIIMASIKDKISKEDIVNALVEFKDVFLFPLISGLLFGLGTVAGKRIGEKWFAPAASRKHFETEMEGLDSIEGKQTPGAPDDFDEYGAVADGIPQVNSSESDQEKKWSRKSEAAKRRWANPEYRRKILAKRRAKMAAAKLAEKPVRTRGVQIGAMDSVTHSSDEKAAAINRYARSLKLRSERMQLYKRDQMTWMNERLDEGAPLRRAYVDPELKKKRREERSRLAEERHRRMRLLADSSASESECDEQT
ncbi:hypothetical protein FVE85_8295 [Porphyridium purpureum]|uniref:Uncharacterized protein n=1 Tax=Porphyridium purpureum TaxID=35688 RepID=A0A5J4YMC7_PORPP|nr:hypothetical protein FVE85_8295 [Porphyridium purpureum]|eukprot:POR6830..scf244_11